MEGYESYYIVKDADGNDNSVYAHIVFKHFWDAKKFYDNVLLTTNNLNGRVSLYDLLYTYTNLEKDNINEELKYYFVYPKDIRIKNGWCGFGCEVIIGIRNN